MHKSLYILFFTLLTNYISAQNSLTVEYKIKLNEIVSTSSNSKQGNLMASSRKEAMKIIPNYLYRLKIDLINKVALFERDDNFLLADGYSKRAMSMVNNAMSTRGTWLTVIDKDSVFNDVTIAGKSFYTRKSINEIEWKIYNEQKHILGFTCYKATAVTYKEDSFFGETGKTKTEYEIWFTPQVNGAFGPSFYQGVPGLVLEVNTKEASMYAVNIKESEEEISLKIPNKKSYTEKETENQVKQIMGLY